MAPPTQSAYAAAKFGVRGFTEALRQEMIATGRPVTVHCVHPGGVRTNIVRNGRLHPSLTGPGRDVVANFERTTRTTPDKAALVILRGVARNKARILVGADAYVYAGVHQLLSSRYMGIVGRLGRATLRRDATRT